MNNNDKLSHYRVYKRVTIAITPVKVLVMLYYEIICVYIYVFFNCVLLKKTS